MFCNLNKLETEDVEVLHAILCFAAGKWVPEGDLTEGQRSLLYGRHSDLIQLCREKLDYIAADRMSPAMRKLLDKVAKLEKDVARLRAAKKIWKD